VIDVRNDGHVAHVRGLVCKRVRFSPCWNKDVPFWSDLPIKARISSIVKL
jgi:hypothetical protein